MDREYTQCIQWAIAVVKKKIKEMDRSLSQKEAYAIVEQAVLESPYDLRIDECKEVIEMVYAKTRSKIGPLEIYMRNDDINEIMVNGPENTFIEHKGGEIRYVRDCFDSTQELENIIRNIASGVNREINEMSPILDARLPDGSRVNAVYKNVAVNGPVLTIRRFRKDVISIEEMIENGTLTEECADFLEQLVRCGYNIFVSGGTSSGKTTFLNALSQYIPGQERVIVIEDSTELKLDGISNLVQLECHNANSMGQGQVTMSNLIKSSLRMRPDRIIVGEVRGAEVIQMLQAMNTGHDGSLSTGHANSVKGMLRRLESMYLMGATIPIDAVRGQIVEGIDMMIHLSRMENGIRKVVEVQELEGFKEGEYRLNPLFGLDKNLNLIRSGNDIVNKSKMILKGEDNCNGL